MSRLEALIAKLARPAPCVSFVCLLAVMGAGLYLKETPYCETASKPLFHTSVTSQALVADRRHDRKAETALPPTIRQWFVSLLCLRLLLLFMVVMRDARDGGRGRGGACA